MSLAAVPSRDEATASIRDARARLTALIDGLSESEIEARATLGGGEWSIKDLIGHLSSWEERALRWLGDGGTPDPESYPQTDEFNAAEIARKSRWSLDETRTAAAASHQQLLDAIERMDNESWLAEVPVPGHDDLQLGRVVGLILAGDEHGLFAHDLAHLGNVEAYVQTLAQQKQR